MLWNSAHLFRKVVTPSDSRVRTEISKEILLNDLSGTHSAAMTILFAAPLPMSLSQAPLLSLTPRTIQRSNALRRLSHPPDRVVMSYDLLVVGCGILGTLVAKNWGTRHHSTRIVCETRTKRRHGALKELGFETRVEGEDWGGPIPENIVVTAPPSGNDDYPGVVRKAASRWGGTERGGTLVFTSSAAVYAQTCGVVTEDSDIGKSERVMRLLKAEEGVLDKGGCVIRLAGLYQLDRGPHSAYLKSGKVSRGRNGLINLICYEDAAEMVIKVLEKGARNKVFLGTDGVPMTREELVEAAKTTRFYGGMDVHEWGPDDTVTRKRLDNSWSRKFLDWRPRYASFREYIDVHRDVHAKGKVTVTS